MSNAIQLRGDYERYEAEVAATQSVTPGMVVEEVAAGLQPVASDKVVEKAFAVENALAGGDITDAVTAGNVAQYNIQQAGNRVYAWIVNGSTATVAKNTLLSPSTTAGVLAAGGNNPIAVLAEAVACVENVSRRCIVRVL